ncbi:hypothetical protein JKA74_04950 [Marivirga sp. S37H4]|uniref:Uncharacterized protein n=1 Tax=Marivirga aurantiaca TaxID=2802615 RepID=A0A934WWX3_9BACT|nr:hypothetical protein [Marivirga aurantiaca]MBK6264375.1 hypothetical protein [Marivirga aurantiaca]
MKTIKSTVWVFLLIALTTILFTGCGNEEEFAPAQEAMEDKLLESVNARTSDVIEFSLKGVEDGRHQIAKNSSTGSIMYVAVQRGTISSMTIIRRDGSAHTFDDFSDTKPYSGCRDGFQKCFYHPICGYICLRVCVAANLTISIGQDW